MSLDQCYCPSRRACPYCSRVYPCDCAVFRPCPCPLQESPPRAARRPRVVLAAALDPHGTGPDVHALWPDPPGSPGDRLRADLGLTREQLLRLDRRHLCGRRYSGVEARANGSRLLAELSPGDVVVAAGRRTMAALRVPPPMPPVGTRATLRGVVVLYAPSWTRSGDKMRRREGVLEKLRSALRELAPEVYR